MKASLHAFARDMKQAEAVAGNLGIACHAIEKHGFPDGESLVTVAPETGAAVIYIALDHPDEKLFPLLLAAGALRANGARRLVLVAPYLCYMRQDRAFRPGQAVSQQAIGRLFGERFDRIVTVDAHLHRTAALDKVFPGIEAENLLSTDVIAETLMEDGYDPGAFIVGPDGESGPLINAIAAKLGCRSMTGRKIRHGDHEVELSFADAAQVKGRAVVMVDDIVSSGTTVKAAAEALRKAGAASIDVIVTHALFPESLMAEFRRAGVRSVRSSTSVPHATNAIPLAGLLAAALRKECA